MKEKKESQPSIIHIDMDCFFAAVEVKDNPELSGKPVIVGADPKGRGVVSAASYEAREYGIHSAMPISKAYHLCPHGVFLPVNSKRYVEESEKIMAIFRSYTPLVEPLSLDEAFLDVSGSTRLFGDTVTIAREIKKRIREEQGLVASVGVAPVKFVAKIASDYDKPDGFVVVTRDDVLDFLAPLPIERMWGVGKVMEKKLKKIGIHTIGELAQIPEKDMVRMFGKPGHHFHQLARGIDPRTVIPYEPVKSVGNEFTFSEDIGDPEIVKKRILQLSEKVGSRLRRKNFQGRVVTLKLRYENFQTVTRSRTHERCLRNDNEIYNIARTLFEEVDIIGRKVRLIGISVSGLIGSSAQSDLFAGENERMGKVQSAVDDLRKRFGNDVITRARFKENSSNDKKEEIQ